MKHLKQEFDKLTFKEVLIYILAIVSVIAGFVMIFLGMYIPPEGQIHESILTAFGLTLVFAGSLLGISMHYADMTTKFKAEITKQIQELTQQRDSDKE